MGRWYLRDVFSAECNEQGELLIYNKADQKFYFKRSRPNADEDDPVDTTVELNLNDTDVQILDTKPIAYQEANKEGILYYKKEINHEFRFIHKDPTNPEDDSFLNEIILSFGNERTPADSQSRPPGTMVTGIQDFSLAQSVFLADHFRDSTDLEANQIFLVYVSQVSPDSVKPQRVQSRGAFIRRNKP